VGLKIRALNLAPPLSEKIEIVPPTVRLVDGYVQEIVPATMKFVPESPTQEK
jgi:hypothetical protein